MEQKFSAWIGIVGGIIDLVVGASVIQSQSEPMGTQSMMSVSAGSSTGYVVLALGIVVLMTGLYLLVTRLMQHRQGFGLLMILYGLVMLVLGAGMIGQMFMMMQASLISGSVMIVVGLAMLYSGADMVRR